MALPDYGKSNYEHIMHRVCLIDNGILCNEFTDSIKPAEYEIYIIKQLKKHLESLELSKSLRTSKPWNQNCSRYD